MRAECICNISNRLYTDTVYEKIQTCSVLPNVLSAADIEQVQCTVQSVISKVSTQRLSCVESAITVVTDIDSVSLLSYLPLFQELRSLQNVMKLYALSQTCEPLRDLLNHALEPLYQLLATPALSIHAHNQFDADIADDDISIRVHLRVSALAQMLHASPVITEVHTYNRMLPVLSNAYTTSKLTTPSKHTNADTSKKQGVYKPTRQYKTASRTINQFLRFLQSSQIQDSSASMVTIHLCDLQAGYLRSAPARILIHRRHVKKDNDHVLVLQHLPLKCKRDYKTGLTYEARIEPYYELAITGIDNGLLRQLDVNASTAAFAMTHTDGSLTDRMMCIFSVHQDTDTGMYYLRLTPPTGGYWALATALWAVPKHSRLGVLHGSIKIGNNVYSFSEKFLTVAYSTGSNCKTTEHTVYAEVCKPQYVRKSAS
jgi:hypothetical protein